MVRTSKANLVVPSSKPNMAGFMDLTGQNFGFLRVEGYAGYRVSTDKKWHYWWCVCECGTRKQIVNKLLRNGRAVSCGCLKSIRAKLLRKYDGGEIESKE